MTESAASEIQAGASTNRQAKSKQVLEANPKQTSSEIQAPSQPGPSQPGPLVVDHTEQDNPTTTIRRAGADAGAGDVGNDDCRGDGSEPITFQHSHPDAMATHLQRYLGLRMKRARELVIECGPDAINRAVLDLPYGPEVKSAPGFFTERTRFYAEQQELQATAPVLAETIDADDVAAWDEMKPADRVRRVKALRDYNRRYGPMYVGTPMGEKYGPREGDTLRTPDQDIPIKYRGL